MATSTYIALLRGINVGGHNLIRMDALRKSLERLPLKNVRTYVQSGNVIFEASTQASAALTTKLERQILRDFGASVAVMLRTPERLGKLIRRNPFLKREGIDPSRLHVAFLSNAPEKAALQALTALSISPDEFHPAGSEIYLYYPNGAGKSKLPNNLLEKILGVRATSRNWNTVQRLFAMAAEPD